MKILEITSDWKWTGPAEPMLVSMAALRDRGHQVDLVCPEAPPGANRSLWGEALLRNLPPIQSIAARRGAIVAGDGERVLRLRRWLATEELGGPYDIVQCWHARDHVLAARALRLGLPFVDAGRRSRLVRFDVQSSPVAAWPWNRWLYGPACDGLICVSGALERNRRPMRRGRPVSSTSGAIDLEALETRKSRRSVREDLGVPESAELVGVVARMQAHRRFDLLLGALRRLAPERPDLRLVLIGRGTHVDEVVRAPARRLGVADRVVFAGYRVEDYADVLQAMDLFTFLVPGSDGTCRALLQAAALGLPLVGSRRGAIPEIISNGQTGLLVEEDSDAIASAWSELFGNSDRRRTMGEAARADARARFRPDRFAAWLERFYREVRAFPG